MTEIKFTHDDNSKILTLDINGHAGYADEGQDIVCSAISIFAYTLAEHIALLYDGGMLEDKPVIKLNPGEMQIKCKAKDETYHYIQNTFAFVRLGYAIIANTYPDNVKLLVNPTED